MCSFLFILIFIRKWHNCAIWDLISNQLNVISEPKKMIRNLLYLSPFLLSKLTVMKNSYLEIGVKKGCTFGIMLFKSFFKPHFRVEDTYCPQKIFCLIFLFIIVVVVWQKISLIKITQAQLFERHDQRLRKFGSFLSSSYRE